MQRRHREWGYLRSAIEWPLAPSDRSRLLGPASRRLAPA
jgi:hypothetical protein